MRCFSSGLNVDLIDFDERPALVDEIVERGEGFLLRARRRGHGHVVEQVEAVHGRGIVLHVGRSLEPRLGRGDGDVAHLLEALLIPRLAGDLLKLLDGVFELALQVLDALLVHLVAVVERDVDEHHGDVQEVGEVLVPRHHRLADAGGAQHEVGKRHVALAVRAFPHVGVGQVDARVGAQVVGESQLALGVLQQRQAAALRGDGGCLAFGIHHVQPQRLGYLGRKVGRAPAYLLATFLGLVGILVHLLCKLAEDEHGRNVLRRRALGSGRSCFF